MMMVGAALLLVVLSRVIKPIGRALFSLCDQWTYLKCRHNWRFWRWEDINKERTYNAGQIKYYAWTCTKCRKQKRLKQKK